MIRLPCPRMSSLQIISPLWPTSTGIDTDLAYLLHWHQSIVSISGHACGGVMAVHRLSRQLVYGCRGMICSNSPLAASVGIKVLQEGGNAFDAALAVAAVETVTVVSACGLGGDSFVLLYEAQTGKITGIISSGVAATGAASA